MIPRLRTPQIAARQAAAKPTEKVVIVKKQPSFQQRSIWSGMIPLEARTIEEVAKQLGMDFVVEKRRQHYYGSTPKTTERTARNVYDKEGNETVEEFENPSKIALVRTDTYDYLGDAGVNYGVVQFKDALDFSEAMVEDGSASYIRGYRIGVGSSAYVIMKTAQYISLGEGDKIECYFYLRTSHDSSCQVELVPTPYREHTGIMLLPGLAALKFKHTKHVINRMARAKRSLKAVENYFEKFEKSFRLLREVKADEKKEEEFLTSLVPDPKGGNSTHAERVRAKIHDIFITDPTLRVPSCNGTMLGLYFASIQYIDDFSTTKKSTKMDQTGARIHSRLTGTAAKKKAEALAFMNKILEKF